ncbi:hypothetical protein AB0O75_24915 [Streptomyces sp. NPDC088921]|uniref:hypothetical protein n=1 Tax=unclassified Streptomyces TaxID=2593676 RepID=UPI00343FDB44
MASSPGGPAPVPTVAVLGTAWPAGAGDAGARLPFRRVRAMRTARGKQPLSGGPDVVTA